MVALDRAQSAASPLSGQCLHGRTLWPAGLTDVRVVQQPVDDRGGEGLGHELVDRCRVQPPCARCTPARSGSRSCWTTSARASPQDGRPRRPAGPRRATSNWLRPLLRQLAQPDRGPVSTPLRYFVLDGTDHNSHARAGPDDPPLHRLAEPARPRQAALRDHREGRDHQEGKGSLTRHRSRLSTSGALEER